MHRSLVLSLVLLAIIRSPAIAQTCLGLASFSTAPMQVTANGSYSDLSTSVGATLGYGIPASLFGNLGIATTAYDPEDGSSLGLAARAGYQMNFGGTRPIQVCPIASFGIGMGPTDEVGGFERSSRDATIGLNAGIELTANPRMMVVPSAGLSYGYGTHKAEDNGGATLYEISSSYGLAQIGVGIILNQNISLRPGVEIPLGIEESHPRVGITLGYNFGARSHITPSR